MDDQQAILDSIPGLEERLSKAGVDQWLAGQKTVTVEGKKFYVLSGDRFAGLAEAKLFFAFERALVSDEEMQRANAGVPLPSDVETVEIETDEPGES